MKPDWKDAPEWAQYLAMDADSNWYWFEYQPSIHRNIWWDERGRVEDAFLSDNWQESLEQRP